MGIEPARRVALGRSKKQSPPILSHEFVIQNHGDLISCVIMVVMVGFMFQITAPISKMFIVPQYNETATASLPNESEPQMLYRSGPLDAFTIVFYALTWIAVHCAVQEYLLDKMQRRLQLSKTKQTKFSESGQLLLFSLYSIGHIVYVLNGLTLQKDPTQLWTGYPEGHRYLPFIAKLFFILQIAYWLHQFPELYFQKLKRDEIYQRTLYSFLFLVLISASYFANFNRLGFVLLLLEYSSQAVFHFSRLLYFSGRVKQAMQAFKIWNFIFLLVRLATIVVSVITLWFGLRQIETPYVDIAAGNFNTSTIRLNALLVIVLVQAYMVFNFSSFHLARHREATRLANSGGGGGGGSEKKSKAKKTKAN